MRRASRAPVSRRGRASWRRAGRRSARRCSRRDCRWARRPPGSPGPAPARGRGRRAAARRPRAARDNAAAARRGPTACDSLAGAGEGVGRAGQLQRHGDVLQRRHGRQEVERLEHDADAPAAKPRKLRPRRAGRDPRRRCTTEPESGRSSPAMVISSVDLPEPDGPTRPTASPRSTAERDALQDVHPRGARPRLRSTSCSSIALTIPLSDPISRACQPRKLLPGPAGYGGGLRRRPHIWG